MGSRRRAAKLSATLLLCSSAQGGMCRGGERVTSVSIGVGPLI